MTSDVLIIGGGVIGLSIARELGSRGVERITLVDCAELRGGSSWAAAGMLAPNIEAGGSDAFHRFCIESLDRYPGFADDLLAETGVDIELDRTGTLGVAFDETENDGLEKHVAPGARRLSAREIERLEPSISDKIVGGILFPNDWQVENRKLIAALRRSADLRRIQIEHAEISRLMIDGTTVTGAATTEARFEANTTVLATGAWTSLIKTGGFTMPFDVKPIRGQMVSFAGAGRLLSHVVFSARGYLVPRADGRVLVGATVEDVGFENRTTDEGVEALRQAAVELFPALADISIAETWSGLRPFVSDGLPVIGRLPGLENVLVATAHYRNGILLAPRTAEIIADRIVGNVDSEFFNAFGAGRFGSVMNATTTI